MIRKEFILSNHSTAGRISFKVMAILTRKQEMKMLSRIVASKLILSIRSLIGFACRFFDWFPKFHLQKLSKGLPNGFQQRRLKISLVLIRLWKLSILATLMISSSSKFCSRPLGRGNSRDDFIANNILLD